jgi:hypothetical protein
VYVELVDPPRRLAAAILDALPEGWKIENKCGCGHPPHPGFVCGYPIPYADDAAGRHIPGVKCGCEG